MCDFTGIFVQGHISLMGNVYIPVYVVTYLIALKSYEVYILIYAYELISICGIGDIFVWFWCTYDNSMVNKR